MYSIVISIFSRSTTNGKYREYSDTYFFLIINLTAWREELMIVSKTSHLSLIKGST